MNWIKGFQTKNRNQVKLNKNMPFEINYHI